MSKFKVGDKVRCIIGTYALEIGVVYTVANIRPITSGGNILIDVRDEKGALLTYWYETRFELINDMKELTYKLPDGFEVKDGMILEVKSNSGGPSLWLVMIIQGNLILQCLHNPQYGMHSSSWPSSFFMDGIVKIYEGFSAGLSYAEYIISLNKGDKPKSKVIWEKNPTKVKISKADIAEKFGIKETQIELI